MTKVDPAIEFELVKLLLQFFGALAIAYLTVHWALRRYKSEKTWERETAAVSSLLTAFRELLEISRQQRSELVLISLIGVSDEGKSDRLAALSKREDELKKIRESVGIATLILPDPIAGEVYVWLAELSLDSAKHTSQIAKLDSQIAILTRAIGQIEISGRKLLRGD